MVAKKRDRAVLYLRYSSVAQSEQSIEGQRRACRAFAKSQNLIVVDEYIDRATSASRDTSKRTSFLEMIKDSERGGFDYVVVYKLDRFARDRYDFAYYKKRLQENGIRLLSATEGLSDRPESIIIESVLEGFAEYYSRELSQKVRRGMHESSLKCQYLGGPVPLGFKIVDKKFVIDEETAPIVKRVFTEYTKGKSLRDIAWELNSIGVKSCMGNNLTAMSIKRILENEKYIGVYKAKDVYVEDVIEPIVSKELFEKANNMLGDTKHNLSKNPDTPSFLLAGKVYCGKCGRPMIADCGTSKTGKVYYYYKCSGKKTYHLCDKASERKDSLEALVIERAKECLTDEFIKDISFLVAEKLNGSAFVEEIKVIKNQLKQLKKEKDNLANAVANGIINSTIVDRLNDTEQKENRASYRLEELENQQMIFTEEHITYYLQHLRSADQYEEGEGKAFINTFIDRVEVFDSDENESDKTGHVMIHCRIGKGTRKKSSYSVPLSPPFVTKMNSRLSVSLDEDRVIIHYWVPFTR